MQVFIHNMTELQESANCNPSPKLNSNISRIRWLDQYNVEVREERVDCSVPIRNESIYFSMKSTVHRLSGIMGIL